MTAKRPARSPSRGGTDFKALYRKLERTLGRIERIEEIEKTLEMVIRQLVRDFADDLGFQGGRLYKREGDAFVLCCVYGRGVRAQIGYRIPVEYAPIRRVLAEGMILMQPGDPGVDQRIEGPIGVSTFVAIAVGEDNAHILSFSIKGEIQEQHTLYSLNAVRHVINLKLRQQKLTNILQEARIIQESLLPSGPPDFDGYDIDGRSRPTEIVGGDLFDYLPISKELIGVAIADASGHGLPAALLARDVVTGLRVGIAEDMKIIKVVERLNRVIHRSALSSKFVSLFYAEIDPGGNFIYTNAGHNPALYLRGRKFEELRRGGLVLGPNPEARYERGYIAMNPGDMIVLFTDGIIETEGRRGHLFGVERLKRLLRGMAGSPAREVVAAVFAAVDEFSGGTPQNDDMTVVVVRRL